VSVLRSIESKLESLFEGVFGRAFRTNVQPVELARKLVKEMDDHRNVSVSRVYVPNEYSIYLSPGDREQFSSYEDNLREELQDYLAEHARRENYVLLTPPRVKFETDEDLDVGVFGIATRLVQTERRDDSAPASQPEPGATMVYKPVQQPTEAASAVDLGVERESAFLKWDGQRREITSRRAVIGRSKECDIQVADPNVSRRHAELRQEGATYWLIDLDSTNGVEVRGKRVKRLKLEDGTRFTIGSTEITFDREAQ
jgi:FhaA, N-terminal domain/FHA domain